MHAPPMLSLADMSAPVRKLGGARFNPETLVAHGYIHVTDVAHVWNVLKPVYRRSCASREWSAFRCWYRRSRCDIGIPC